MASLGGKPLTPAERIKYLRREHARLEYPVAHCRKDRQNWPCDTIAALDAATEVERERICKLADWAGARYLDGGDWSVSAKFSDLIRKLDDA